MKFRPDLSGAVSGMQSLGLRPHGSLQRMPQLPNKVSGTRFRPFGTGSDCDTPVWEEHRYARTGGSQYFSVPNGSSSLILPQGNGLRNFLMMRNSSATANVYVDFGNNASLNTVLRLTANQIVLFDTVVPQEDIYAYGDAASAFLSIIVSSIPGRSC